MKNYIFLLDNFHFYKILRVIMLFGLLSESLCWTAETSPFSVEGILHLNLPAGWKIAPQGNAVWEFRKDDERLIGRLISWEIPRGGSPQSWAAAAAYECLLFEQKPYRRLANEIIKGPNNIDWHLIFGETLLENGETGRIIFAATAAAGKYWILQPDQPFRVEDRAQSSLLRDLIACIEFTAINSSYSKASGLNDTSSPLETSAKPPRVQETLLTPPMRPLAAPPSASEALATPQRIKAQPESPLSKPTYELTRPEPSTASLPIKPQPLPTLYSNPAPAPESANLNNESKAISAVGEIEEEANKTRQFPSKQGLNPIDAPTASILSSLPKFVRFVSPYGFSMELPEGWEATVIQGRILVRPSAHTIKRAEMATPYVVIWPVAYLPEGQEPLLLALELLEKINLEEKSKISALRHRFAGPLVIVTGKIGEPGALKKFVACCYVQGHQGLLTALIVPAQAYQASMPLLLRILNSFQGGPWIAELPEPLTEIWQDPVAGWLRISVPQGWRVRGQLISANGRWGLSLDLEDTSAQRLRCVWRQPVLPLFRELTPALRNLGWQEGDRYPTMTPGDYLRLLPFMDPLTFLQRYWLSMGPSRLQEPAIEQSSLAPEWAPLIEVPDAKAWRILLRGKREGEERQRLCVVVTGKAAIKGETACWQAAIVEAEAPIGASDALEKAQRILYKAIMGATLSPEAPAEAHVLLAKAKAACNAFWGAYKTEENVKFLVDLFSTRSPKQTGRLWLFNPASLEPWQKAWQALQKGQPLHLVMPELTEDFGHRED